MLALSEHTRPTDDCRALEQYLVDGAISYMSGVWHWVAVVCASRLLFRSSFCAVVWRFSYPWMASLRRCESHLGGAYALLLPVTLQGIARVGYQRCV